MIYGVVFAGAQVTSLSGPIETEPCSFLVRRDVLAPQPWPFHFNILDDLERLDLVCHGLFVVDCNGPVTSFRVLARRSALPSLQWSPVMYALRHRQTLAYVETD